MSLFNSECVDMITLCIENGNSRDKRAVCKQVKPLWDMRVNKEPCNRGNKAKQIKYIFCTSIFQAFAGIFIVQEFCVKNTK